jgi:hypothetical protein
VRRIFIYFISKIYFIEVVAYKKVKNFSMKFSITERMFKNLIYNYLQFISQLESYTHIKYFWIISPIFVMLFTLLLFVINTYHSLSVMLFILCLSPNKCLLFFSSLHPCIGMVVYKIQNLESNFVWYAHHLRKRYIGIARDHFLAPATHQFLHKFCCI